MTVNAEDVYFEMTAEAAKMARRMVYLEDAAREAYRRRLWTTVGELHEQRGEVQAYRSELLRDVWHWRRRRRRRVDWAE
jgi:hypothetical protein